MAIGDERAPAPGRSLSPEARNRLGGLLLLGAGGILLIVSLFLDWFEPGGLSAWTVFEVLDMVLAALGVTAVIAAAGALTAWRPVPERWVIVVALVAPVIVVVSLINHPPAVHGIGADPMVGLWLALAGSLLMLVGAVLAVARISLAVDLAAPRAVGTPVGARGPDVPAPGGRFVVGRRGAADPSVAPPPVTTPPETPLGGEGPTTPTRPL